MVFSLSNLLKSKNTNENSEPLPKIDFKGGTKYAENLNNDVYLDFEELGGFPFIKTIIIGDISTKIKRTGCTLTFKFENNIIVLNSDNTTIESEKIKNTQVFFTEIDFELDEDEAKKIKNDNVEEISYTFKNKIYSFKPI
ncbi:hypothetical protein [uncultured Lutibacter sp.]|uniref:hypothetical protein n=1 Tax=uncultured Lutibacter sp. TaxID=437739 RepID=UPI0026080507|nr:hypothetical protein [uncultured Lutibacter sp.]